MKTENTSAAVENTESKQAWSAPTLTTLAVSLDTLSMATAGGDGSTMGATSLT